MQVETLAFQEFVALIEVEAAPPVEWIKEHVVELGDKVTGDADAVDGKRVESIEIAVGQPGGLVVAFAHASDESATAALFALAEASVPILAFELEGARLSDAFLAMTGE